VNARHLYIHVPFCARRCTYCDFSIAVRQRTPVAEYLAALTGELELTGPLGDLTTVYLGGGTPSRLGGEGIARLADLLGRPAGLAEFTIEANPDDVTAAAVRAWVAAGVNRISLGAQSFDPAVLAWMHRTHDAGQIATAVGVARDGGLANISLDLIFALPEALHRDWARDLDLALALLPDHVSLYGLTVEAGTPLFRQIGRGESAAPPDSRYAEEYLLAHQRLGAAGLRFYEVSNAGRPGREAVHNRAYWRRVPYLGLGPSAHSFDGSTRWWNEPAYARWVALLKSGTRPVAGREILADAQRDLEQLYLGLRTVEGIELEATEAARLGDKLKAWGALGWLTLTPLPSARLSVRPSAIGWLRLDELVASI